MSDQRYDQDGNLYRKNWAGQWIEQTGPFGAQEHYQGALNPVRSGEFSYDGKPLYTQFEGSTSTASGSSEFAIGLIFLLMLITPFLFVASLPVGVYLVFRREKQYSPEQTISNIGCLIIMLFIAPLPTAFYILFGLPYAPMWLKKVAKAIIIICDLLFVGAILLWIGSALIQIMLATSFQQNVF